MQRKIDLDSLRTSYMWTDDDPVPQKHETTNDRNTYPTMTMPYRNSDEPTNQSYVTHSINPHLSQFLDPRSSKISPYPNNWKQQTAPELLTERPIPRPITPPNVSVHTNQKIHNQTTKLTKHPSNTQKKTYKCVIKWAIVVAICLCIVAIVVPISIYFGLQ